MTDEQASEAQVVLLIRIARSVGDKDLEDLITGTYAKVAAVVEAQSSFAIRPGARFYETNNWCSTCGRVYPKEIGLCSECRRKLRTKPRD